MPAPAAAAPGDRLFESNRFFWIVQVARHDGYAPITLSVTIVFSSCVFDFGPENTTPVPVPLMVKPSTTTLSAPIVTVVVVPFRIDSAERVAAPVRASMPTLAPLNVNGLVMETSPL